MSRRDGQETLGGARSGQGRRRMGASDDALDGRNVCEAMDWMVLDNVCTTLSIVKMCLFVAQVETTLTSESQKKYFHFCKHVAIKCRASTPSGVSRARSLSSLTPPLSPHTAPPAFSAVLRAPLSFPLLSSLHNTMLRLY